MQKGPNDSSRPCYSGRPSNDGRIDFIFQGISSAALEPRQERRSVHPFSSSGRGSTALDSKMLLPLSCMLVRGALRGIKHAKPLPLSLGSNQACNTVSSLSTADRPLRHWHRNLPAHMTAQSCGLTGGWLLAGLCAILVPCECSLSITERDALA